MIKKIFFFALMIFGNNLAAEAQLKTVLTENDAKLLKPFAKKFVHLLGKYQLLITHGQSDEFLSFFRALGTPYYYTAVVNKKPRPENTATNLANLKVIASGCCILREMNDLAGNKVKTWYVCDVKKLHKAKYKDQLSKNLFAKEMFKRMLQCRKAFTISFDPPGKTPPSDAIKLFKHTIPIVKPQEQTLNLYALNAEQLEKNLSKLTQIMRNAGKLKAHEELGCVSTAGKQDYELIVNGEPKKLNIWHLKPNATTKNFSANKLPDALFLLCSVKNTLLDKDLSQLLGAPFISGQILSFDMKNVDFNQLTTDQIALNG